MSFVKIVHLYCDGPDLGLGCPLQGAQAFGGQHYTAAEARDVARSKGWLVGLNGRDYCPACRKQGRGER